MADLEKRTSLLKSKILYTLLIIWVYLLGKGLPLYMIDVPAYLHRQVDAETLLMQTISGDINQCSLFALGISPYMISSIIFQIISACKSSEAKKRTSPRKTKKMTLILTLLICIVMAIVKVQELQFRVTGNQLMVAQIIAALEMVTGAILILHLISRNRKYGVGGQTILIFLNIIDGILVTLRGHNIKQLLVPLIFSVIVMIVMIIMENTEKRIPLQRISIHNIYADKNYLAIKFNPIGVMPAMFATAVFMLPQLFVSMLGLFLPNNPDVLWWQDNMTLLKPTGIVVYVVILFGLTVGFSRVTINPRELTEQFLKSGDSIRDLHAGRDTKRYLSGVITRISFFSATVMSVCLCVPMILQMHGELESTLTTLPSSMMMMTGIWCNLYREVLAVRDLEAYKPFI